MKLGNYFSDNPDLVETYDRLVPWDRVVPLTEGNGADTADAVSTWREVLTLAGRFIGSDVASRAKTVDELGIIRENGKVEINDALKQNVNGLKQLGLLGLPFPKEYDGAGLLASHRAQAVHHVGQRRFRHRARALRRGVDRPRRAGPVHRGEAELRRRTRRAQVHDPRLADVRARVRRHARDAAREAR